MLIVGGSLSWKMSFREPFLNVNFHLSILLCDMVLLYFFIFLSAFCHMCFRHVSCLVQNEISKRCSWVSIFSFISIDDVSKYRISCCTLTNAMCMSNTQDKYMKLVPNGIIEKFPRSSNI